MIVVADAGPIRYLVELGLDHVLGFLFDEVLITHAIHDELRQPHFPDLVRTWADQLPSLVRVASPSQVRFRDQLDEGEASAISLALQEGVRQILIDERKGTLVAQANGLTTIGTLSVLIDGDLGGLIDFEESLSRLVAHTRFRHTPALIEQARQVYEMKRPR